MRACMRGAQENAAGWAEGPAGGRAAGERAGGQPGGRHAGPTPYLLGPSPCSRPLPHSPAPHRLHYLPVCQQRLGASVYETIPRDRRHLSGPAQEPRAPQVAPQVAVHVALVTAGRARRSDPDVHRVRAWPARVIALVFPRCGLSPISLFPDTCEARQPGALLLLTCGRRRTRTRAPFGQAEGRCPFDTASWTARNARS